MEVCKVSQLLKCNHIATLWLIFDFFALRLASTHVSYVRAFALKTLSKCVISVPYRSHMYTDVLLYRVLYSSLVPRERVHVHVFFLSDVRTWDYILYVYLVFIFIGITSPLKGKHGSSICGRTADTRFSRNYKKKNRFSLNRLFADDVQSFDMRNSTIKPTRWQ